jgi:hypothetical protein
MIVKMCFSKKVADLFELSDTVLLVFENEQDIDSAEMESGWYKDFIRRLVGIAQNPTLFISVDISNLVVSLNKNGTGFAAKPLLREPFIVGRDTSEVEKKIRRKLSEQAGNVAQING